jgi:hypothetical protein
MTFTEIIRWAALCGGAIVLGLHFAVYKNAERVTFHPKGWRIFIMGNALLTTYALGALLTEKEGTTLYIVFTAMLVTLLGAVVLDLDYRSRKRKDVRYEQRRIQREHRSRSANHR